MDDDVDFFTRKPMANRFKSKQKAKLLSKAAASTSNGITQRTASTAAASSSQYAASAQQVGDVDSPDVAVDVDVLEDEDEDEDGDENAALSNSDADIPSDDSDASAKRRAKRRKKRHAKTLPAWASQGNHVRPSQEPSSSSSSAVFLDAETGTDGNTSSRLGPDKRAATGSTSANANGSGNGRARGVSLTPPPPISPEKLYLAHELVNRTMASKFGTSTASATTWASSAPALSSSNDSASGPRRATRRMRNSATPSFGQDVAAAGSSTVLSPTAATRDDDDDDANGQVHWDPDLARLMRGENARHIREQARREQQEREEKRKQRELERIRQQPSSLPGSSSQRSTHFGRTQSAPQTTIQARSSAANGGNESDDSVEFVARPGRKASTPPCRTRSNTNTRAGAATQTAAAPKNDAIVVIDSDSDDDQESSKGNGTTAGAAAHDPSPSSPPAIEAAGETLALSLQSKVGSISVTVTPTTLLCRIIQHFHDKKLDSSVKVESMRIMFDGFAYKPDQTVGDMDVEDGDQIELSWP
ncbi:hypothetical protein EX895_000711 [Sporisorium graminicola]|uniref:Ubiquitin-like domain-containing protein n=1 Tax=Sporisorium graminicola TaxID=280036 RepID=A0A4U7L0Q5_9BASI|nr:hypothetical protein EX895_000711 [Sporisorium graminicola]TKY90713.1 hypothetical protein EX895_000711 [Sporisorium graminicola]